MFGKTHNVLSTRGAATRVMGQHLAEFVAMHGVASLIDDKRGLGRSTGDWLGAGYGDLAGDAFTPSPSRA